MRFAFASFGLAAVAAAAVAPAGYGTPVEPVPAAYGSPPAASSSSVPPPVAPAAPSSTTAPYSPKNTTIVATTATVHYVTEVLTSYETYCPSATTIEHNGVTYNITTATTLTITNCPCTVTRPVYTTSAPPVVPTQPVETQPAVSVPTVPIAPYPSNNVTAPAPGPPPPATGTGAYTPPASTSPIVPGYTGAATKASFGIAGVLAAAGLVAAL